MENLLEGGSSDPMKRLLSTSWISNSLVLGRCGSNHKSVISKDKLFLSTFGEIASPWRILTVPGVLSCCVKVSGGEALFLVAGQRFPWCSMSVHTLIFKANNQNWVSNYNMVRWISAPGTMHFCPQYDTFWPCGLFTLLQFCKHPPSKISLKLRWVSSVNLVNCGDIFNLLTILSSPEINDSF